MINIFKDCSDPIELLSSKNVNTKALLEYIRDACDFCTDYQVSKKMLVATSVFISLSSR
jgi:hypothetical protein